MGYIVGVLITNSYEYITKSLVFVGFAGFAGSKPTLGSTYVFIFENF
jgi:hypothetical protein